MRHSREFEKAKEDLQKREARLKKEIETDSVRLANSSKKIIGALIAALVLLIVGRIALGRGSKKPKKNAENRSLRWFGRLAETFLPFVFSAILSARKSEPKEISDS